jgi:hypothetical protein
MSRTEARHRKNGRSKGKHPKHFEDRGYHHLTPRSRFGGNERSNLLLINKVRHVEWHRVFSNLTLDEVIYLLQRIKRAKEAQVA